jgi:AraC family transcriptional activator of pobA
MKASQIEKYHYQKDKPKERQFGIYDLAEYYQNNSEHSSQPHTHSFYQIIWFKSKKGKHFIDFKDYQIKENRLFFIAKNQVHYFADRSDYDGYLIHFNESFILSNETDINFFLTYNIFNNSEEPYFQIPNELQNQIISYFTQISTESTNTTEFGNKSILSYLLKSMLLLIEREKRKRTKNDNLTINKNSSFLKFRDLLENNFYKNWSVTDFANKLSISSKTLNSITKHEMDKTVSQVIIDRIVLESKRKLTHSNAYINQIAYDLGFKDPYYFIKYFKKHVKCSPSEFRKSIS